MAARYHQGRRFEYEVRDSFEADGWVVIRSAGSKKKADLICMRAGITLAIQCKRGAWPSPAERAEFLEFCRIAGCKGYVARKERGKAGAQGITLRELWK